MVHLHFKYNWKLHGKNSAQHKYGRRLLVSGLSSSQSAACMVTLSSEPSVFHSGVAGGTGSVITERKLTLYGLL